MQFHSNDFAEKVAFKLQNKVLKKGHDIKLNLYNTPDTPPSNTPLETTVRIGNLENGIYNLSVKLKDRSVPGKLTVSDKAYNLKLEKDTSITVTENTLNKIPLNSIFGRIHYYSSTAIPTINNFLQDLKKAGASIQTYYPGNYGMFFITDNGEIEQKPDKGYPFTKNFIYQYTGDTQKLKELVRQYSLSYTTELLITLRTYDGDLINIWSFDK